MLHHFFSAVARLEVRLILDVQVKNSRRRHRTPLLSSAAILWTRKRKHVYDHGLTRSCRGTIQNTQRFSSLMPHPHQNRGLRTSSSGDGRRIALHNSRTALKATSSQQPCSLVAGGRPMLVTLDQTGHCDHEMLATRIFGANKQK